MLTTKQEGLNQTPSFNIQTQESGRRSGTHTSDEVKTPQKKAKNQQSSIILEQFEIKSRGEKQQLQIKHETQLRTLSRQYESKLNLKNDEVSLLNQQNIDLQQKLNILQQQKQSLEKSLKMHESPNNIPISAFPLDFQQNKPLTQNSPQALASPPTHLIERIKQLEEERESLTFKLIQIGRIYKEYKQSSAKKQLHLVKKLPQIQSRVQDLSFKLTKFTQSAHKGQQKLKKQVCEIAQQGLGHVYKMAEMKFEEELFRQRKLRQNYFCDLIAASGNVRVICRIKPKNTKNIVKKARKAMIQSNDTQMIESYQQSSNNQQFSEQNSQNDNDPTTTIQLKTQITVDKNDPKQVVVYHQQWNARQNWLFDEVIDRNFGNQKLLISVEPFIRLLLTQKEQALGSTILAYGQTCSGKTYSLFGSDTETGLFQFTLQYFLKKQSSNHQPSNSKIKLKIQMCQIYLDNVYDLLGQKKGDNQKIQLDFKSLMKSGQKIEEGHFLQSIEISDYDQAREVLDRGMKQRQVGANNVHEHSSRSHLIVRLKVIMDSDDDNDDIVDKDEQSKLQSSSSKIFINKNQKNSITFVDLAGSERLQTLKSTPQRLKKETVFINKSLSALGDVIHSKSNNSKHIPYRNSVLTTLLRGDLQGSNKKVLLVAHLDAQNFKQSVNTLTLASKVQNINLHNVVMNKKKK